MGANLVPAARRTRSWRSPKGSLRYRGWGDARHPDIRLQQALSRVAAAHVGPDASRHPIDWHCMAYPILACPKPGCNSPRLYLRAAIWKRQRLDECRLRRSWSCSTSIAGANKKCRVPLRWRIFGRWWCGWQFLTCSIAINRVDFRVSSRTRSHQKVTIARGKGAVRVPFPGSELCSPDTATAALDVDPRAT